MLFDLARKVAVCMDGVIQNMGIKGNGYWRAIKQIQCTILYKTTKT